jgi:hypothetical protein
MLLEYQHWIRVAASSKLSPPAFTADYEQALVQVETKIFNGSIPAPWYDYIRASCYSCAIQCVEADEKISQSKRLELQKTYRSKAVECLLAAESRLYFDYADRRALFLTDPVFVAIHEEPEIKETFARQDADAPAVNRE